MLLAASPACAPGLLRSEGPADAQTVGVPCLPAPSLLVDVGRQSVTPSVSVDKGDNGISWCRVCQAVRHPPDKKINLYSGEKRARGDKCQAPEPSEGHSDVRHQGRRQLPEGWGVGRKHAGKPPQAQGPPQPPPQPTILASVRFLGPGWEGAYPSTCTEQGVVLSCRGEDVTVLRQRLRKPTWEPHAAIRAPPAPCPARLLPHLPQPRCETFAPRSPKYGALALCRKT